MIKTDKDLYDSKKENNAMNYKITTRSKKAERQYYEFLKSKQEIPDKLEKLRVNPRIELNAHKLKGKLKGLWSCHLSKNPDIVMIYEIDDKNKEIIVYAVGSHNIYR